ncbi:MAG TPA: molybdopterin oxidoreductase family protein [Actinopolymorphaceae bacterium]
MDFRDKDGEPLITWHDAEPAFGAWRECSRGRPCDYSALTYERLRGGSGIGWPCTEEHPDGVERLYVDGRFNTDPDYRETYGHDLLTGAVRTPEQYSAERPDGRAFLHVTNYVPSPEVTSDRFPLLLTTGRTVYHFHTRTKTARARQLQDAAPEVRVELSPADAERRDIREGDTVRVTSPRGSLEGKARICGVRPGVVFVPFHYGYWDLGPVGPSEQAGRAGRAANELTITSWDPVSKQPIYKVAAVDVVEVAEPVDGEPAPAPTTAASAPIDGDVRPTVGGAAATVVARAPGFEG